MLLIYLLIFDFADYWVGFEGILTPLCSGATGFDAILPPLSPGLAGFDAKLQLLRCGPAGGASGDRTRYTTSSLLPKLYYCDLGSSFWLLFYIFTEDSAFGIEYSALF